MNREVIIGKIFNYMPVLFIKIFFEWAQKMRIVDTC